MQNRRFYLPVPSKVGSLEAQGHWVVSGVVLLSWEAICFSLRMVKFLHHFNNEFVVETKVTARMDYHEKELNFVVHIKFSSLLREDWGAGH